MVDILFGFFFTLDGEGKAGVTATVTIERYSTGTAIVSGLATTPSLINPGWHWYLLQAAPEDNYGAVATTADAVDAPTVPAMAIKQIYTYMDQKISLAGAGAGSVTWTYTLTNTETGLPVPDASVWVTTDIAGLNLVGFLHTDAFGQATFRLNPGTYYVWASKVGFVAAGPDEEVVS